MNPNKTILQITATILIIGPLTVRLTERTGRTKSVFAEVHAKAFAHRVSFRVLWLLNGSHGVLSIRICRQTLRHSPQMFAPGPIRSGLSVALRLLQKEHRALASSPASDNKP